MFTEPLFMFTESRARPDRRLSAVIVLTPLPRTMPRSERRSSRESRQDEAAPYGTGLSSRLDDVGVGDDSTHEPTGMAPIKVAEDAAAVDDDASVTLKCGSDGDITIPPWLAVAEHQHRSALGLTSQSFIEHAQGHPRTGYAFRDRNDLNDDLKRRIFIVPKVDDGYVFVFNEDGTLVDEPNDGTPLGRQVLVDPEHDSKGFLAKWANGYYELALVEPVEIEPEESEGEEGGEEDAERQRYDERRTVREEGWASSRSSACSWSVRSTS